MSRTMAGTKTLLLALFVTGLVIAYEAVGLADPLQAADSERVQKVDPDTPWIQSLSAKEKDGHYLVSFRLESAFDPEILGLIESGLETSFEHRVEVHRQRRFWWDDQVLHRRVEVSVEYDSLSRQYSLSLKIDGDVQESSTTDKPEEMRRWMTEVEDLDLGPVSEFPPTEDFTVQVKSELRSRFVMLFIPWDRDTRWARIPLNPLPVSAHESSK